MEACRIAILEKAPMVFDVGAPMQHKDICYDMLADAQRVIDATENQHFNDNQKCLTLVMDMTGRVDVAAPLPNRGKCALMLKSAKEIIERFNDDTAPVMRAFSDKLVA